MRAEKAVAESHRSGRPTVTIVVAALNERRYIAACLDALLAQDYPAALLSVIVADGGSTDGTREIVNGYPPERVRMIDNPEHIAATAFNRGLRLAGGDVVGIMSAHGVPATDYVSQAIRALSDSGAWAVGGRINRVAASPVQRAIATVTSNPLGVGNAKHNYAEHPHLAETVFPGMWPRQVFDKVGWFDEELVRNQDDEFSFRIRQAGGTIWYDPAISVSYEPRDSLGGLFRQYREYGYWRVRVLQKHPGALQIRQLAPPIWVASVGAGTMGALIRRWPALFLVPSIGLYVPLQLLAARRAGRDISPVLVLAASATLHSAYGIGMLQGGLRVAATSLARRLRRRKSDPGAGSRSS